MGYIKLFRFMSVMLVVQTKCKLNNTKLFLKLFHIQCKEIGNNKCYEETTESWRQNIDVRKEMEDSRLNAIEVRKRSLNFSCKCTTAAYVDLTESLLDNWLKNNHITVDKIYYLPNTCLYFCTNFSFQIYFSTAENRHKNRILWQLAKIRLSE